MKTTLSIASRVWRISFILLSLVSLCGCEPQVKKLPKDDVLEKSFKESRVKFEELIKIFDGQTATWQVGYGPRSFRAEEEKLDAPTLAKIRALLNDLQVNAGITQTEPRTEIILHMDSRGGYEKGFAFCKRPPSSTVPSIDTAKIPAGMGALYKHIVGNWYLWLEYDD